MATSGLLFVRLLLVAYVVSFLFTRNPQMVGGVSVPALSVATAKQQSLDIKNRTLTAVGATKPSLINTLVATEHSGSKSTITTEKLKRGLSNFMNQLDAAPFFVPANLYHANSYNNGKLALYSSADKENAQKTYQLANTIDGYPSTIMKNSNKPLVQIWANGGPGRWGRR